MQNPHCTAPSAAIVVCSRDGARTVPSPAAVRTSAPSQVTVSTRQELAGTPSICTAQTPHSPEPHPSLTSVNSNRRKVSSSVSRTGTATRTGCPLMVSRTS